ncbi:unnamed protein product [Rhizophagus irregularis]|uniref:Myb-like domain-containing protein n=1 Tax=Rhizophagus irregularis TaxID=588596 RepID=A0A915ZT68_9GLOM|nr:unnamed protein product [Rhizophagus irregularis]
MGKFIKKSIKRNQIYKKINSDGNKTIKNYMAEWEKKGKIIKTPFVELSKKLKDEHELNFESKAICDYWWNILDPRLEHSPYSKEEKDHIYEWANKYQENGNIQWTLLQAEMETKFGKFRARNELKNIWNVKKRQLEAKSSNLKKEDDKNEGESECEDELKYDKTDVEYAIEDKGKHAIQFLINKSV